MPFEILTENGLRDRYEDVYHWQYLRVEDGTVDGKEDRSCVEVLQEKNDESEIVQRYSNVCRVGDVTKDVFLTLPLEIRQTQCPRCGHCEKREP